ncbi:alpha-ketoacid dehydrogenase subunit beta [Nocardioides immobilis]|uniref:Alpha-ketoacid dehydrogenase subunit beta n=1 Tax=Nocardioides immobilis TaxID=2049295 RepID=A0A417XWS2_9ACTN|nr:alpha-ketoacid dehydrogenase subunit beta [Nocardioides immobilis]
MTRISYLAAIGEAQREAMAADPRVILIGEDVQSNLYGTAPNFVEMFGVERVRNAPISEEGFVGAAAGAAMTGLRPIVDLTYASFMYMAMDQFVNQVAKNRYMFGGQASLPVVYRASMFYRSSTAAHHSDRPYPMFMNVPGLKIMVPSGAYEAKGLLRTAIDLDDPVLSFEDATLWTKKQDLPDEEFRIPFGVANLVTEGTDVTVVAIAGAVEEARKAVAALAGEGVSAELIDPRTLVPLDVETILKSVAKTGRLVVADPAHRTCGAAAEISALVNEYGFDSLKAPILRVNTPDIQIPFSPSLERPLYPSARRIQEAVKRAIGAVASASP